MESIEGWVNEIKKSNKLIVVEGLKDKRALKELGITKTYHLKKPLFEAVEEISKLSGDVILLTDFDRKGKELYGRLSKDLMKQGTKIDKIFREWLMKNTKLSHIEGISTYKKHLKIVK